jgi:RimJ/RimL family protein N-acetyltransferase
VSGRGLVAAELIADNIVALSERSVSLDRITTWIYSDNVASRALFRGLGFEPTGRRLFHYHLWV